jgi:hypothetical protein
MAVVGRAGDELQFACRYKAREVFEGPVVCPFRFGCETAGGQLPAVEVVFDAIAARAFA